MRYGGPVDTDVLFNAKLKEFLANELCAVVHDDGVWDYEAMDVSRKNSTTCSDLIVEIGQASIHFVNLSMVTSKWV